MTYTLVGFVADTAGDEDRLIDVAPVVRYQDADYVAQGTRWTRDSLKKVAGQDRRYVRYFAEHNLPQINEGDIVWLAGPNFFRDVSLFSELKFQDLSMSSWAAFDRGQRWRAGSRVAFNQFATRLAHYFEEKLHNYLFDSFEMRAGHIEQVFRLYSSLPIPDSRTRELNRALYYFERRFNYDFDFVRTEAVESDMFEGERDFDVAFANLRGRLSARRLSDGVVSPQPVSPSNGGVIHVWASGSSAVGHLYRKVSFPEVPHRGPGGVLLSPLGAHLQMIELTTPSERNVLN